jgi:hypothetical protein
LTYLAKTGSNIESFISGVINHPNTGMNGSVYYTLVHNKGKVPNLHQVIDADTGGEVHMRTVSYHSSNLWWYGYTPWNDDLNTSGFTVYNTVNSPWIPSIPNIKLKLSWY